MHWAFSLLILCPLTLMEENPNQEQSHRQEIVPKTKLSPMVLRKSNREVTSKRIIGQSSQIKLHIFLS